MKYILLSMLIIPGFCFGQNYLNKKIIISLKDSSNLYEKARIALGSNDFIIKETGNKFFITTHPREFKKIPGFAVANAEIINNTIIVTGYFSLMKNINVGYTIAPKNYKPIVYYKNSHGWKLLMQIADKLDGEISYLKE
jgi:hypothetical protein